MPFSRYAVFFFLASFGCAVDLLTKHFIFGKHFDPENPRPIQTWFIDGWFGIETSTNQGALFGMGQGKMAWFAVLSVFAMGGILYWLFVKKAALNWPITISLGAITGGILGNLYDRLGMWHSKIFAGDFPQHAFAVRDWIHFRWEGAPLKIFDPWPNFNIADCLLVCGAIALLIIGFFFAPPELGESESATDKEDAEDTKKK